MGVYIKGMEMPECCGYCPFEYKNYCMAKPSLAVEFADRHPRCPLVPVPPHGELIDRREAIIDANERAYDFWLSDDEVNATIQFLNEQTTIIPAEEECYILALQEEYDGLKRKYLVLKSDTGECVENCFVLRPDKDKAAITALLAYADATDNHVLAKDIRAWISTIPAEEGE